MDDIFDRISNTIDCVESGEYEDHPFYYYEPWDVEVRDEKIIELALNDGVDLRDPSFTKYTGDAPHDFQTGYMLSSAKLRIMLGGSQIGKSHPAKIEAMMMCTHAIPYSLRFDKGVDTGIKRKITEENISRFGRIDISTGKIIDYDKKAKISSEWNCGNIIGAGIYPQDKLAPPGSQIWIGTYQEAKINFWWPSLAENVNNEFPPEFYEKSRGNKGLNKQEGIIFTPNGSRIVFLSYEMGYKKFEAKKAWAYIGDEEMPNSDIFSSAQEHAFFRSIVMTPLNGITWSKDIIFPKNRNKSVKVFHATQYDSPYQDLSDIEVRSKNMESWQRAARIWGFFAEQKGKPFFDRKKILRWINGYTRKFDFATIEPVSKYFGMITNKSITTIPGLVNVGVKMLESKEDNLMNTWRIYEEVQPGVGYIFAADPAEGAETPEAVGDKSAGIFMRLPMDKEVKPVIVATIRSTQEVLQFARTCSYALRYYNNAVLAPERGRGSANAAFGIELEEWPWWYYLTTTQDSIGKQREKKGFDTNSKTRDMIFEFIRDWLDDFTEDEYPCIPDEPLLKELASAVVAIKSNGNKKCDHTNEGTLDSSIAFGILCYIFKFSPEQVKCNLKEPKKNGGFLSRLKKQNSSEPSCGMSSMGYRS